MALLLYFSLFFQFCSVFVKNPHFWLRQPLFNTFHFCSSFVQSLSRILTFDKANLFRPSLFNTFHFFSSFVQSLTRIYTFHKANHFSPSFVNTSHFWQTSSTKKHDLKVAEHLFILFPLTLIRPGGVESTSLCILHPLFHHGSDFKHQTLM